MSQILDLGSPIAVPLRLQIPFETGTLLMSPNQDVVCAFVGSSYVWFSLPITPKSIPNLITTALPHKFVGPTFASFVGDLKGVVLHLGATNGGGAESWFCRDITDPSEEWVSGGFSSMPREGGMVVTVAGSTYLLGGNLSSVELFNGTSWVLTKFRWTNSLVCHCAASSSQNGTVFVTGFLCQSPSQSYIGAIVFDFLYERLISREITVESVYNGFPKSIALVGGQLLGLSAQFQAFEATFNSLTPTRPYEGAYFLVSLPSIIGSSLSSVGTSDGRLFLIAEEAHSRTLFVYRISPAAIVTTSVHRLKYTPAIVDFGLNATDASFMRLSEDPWCRTAISEKFDAVPLDVSHPQVEIVSDDIPLGIPAFICFSPGACPVSFQIPANRVDLALAGQCMAQGNCFQAYHNDEPYCNPRLPHASAKTADLIWRLVHPTPIFSYTATQTHNVTGTIVSTWSPSRSVTITPPEPITPPQTPSESRSTAASESSSFTEVLVDTPSHVASPTRTSTLTPLLLQTATRLRTASQQIPTPPPAASPANSMNLNYIIASAAAIAALIVVVVVVVFMRRRFKKQSVEEMSILNSEQQEFGALLSSDKYKLEKILGRGGYGIVFLASKANGSQVALKYITCSSEKDRNLALREIDIVRNVEHPHIIHIQEFFVNWESRVDIGTVAPKGISPASAAVTVFSRPRYVAIVTPFYEEGDLRRFLMNHWRNETYLSEAQIVSFGWQLAAALLYLHTSTPPIAHRDMKPENVLLSQNGQHVVLTDFGLAIDQEKTFMTTQAGSFPYVAPECWNKVYTNKVDVWSLGCVVYTMCTRRVTQHNLRVMFNDASKPGFEREIEFELCPRYSKGLHKAVMKMLKKNVQERNSMADVLQDFEQLLCDGHFPEPSCYHEAKALLQRRRERQV